MVDLDDLISRKRIRYELGESTMPKKYRYFCLRVIDSERLTPTAKPDQFTPITVKEYTEELCGRIFYISKCPTCGCYLDGRQVQKYCHECGQSLKWSDD